MRSAKAVALIAILISSGFFWRLPEGNAQKRMDPPEYDYYSLAVTSMLNAAREASKLPSIPQRVKLLISAAKMLPASQHDEAVRMLEIGLRDSQSGVRLTRRAGTSGTPQGNCAMTFWPSLRNWIRKRS